MNSKGGNTSYSKCIFCSYSSFIIRMMQVFYTTPYIHKKLSIGTIRLYKDECTFSVTDLEGIKLLISIFDKFNLNTTKYLDYLDFKKAFNLYINRVKKILSSRQNMPKLEVGENTLFKSILELKNIKWILTVLILIGQKTLRL